MSTGELARASLITKGAITQRVDRAEAQGYVRRVTAPGRKVAEVELTDRGRRVSDELVEAVLRHEEGLLAGLPQH
ncbi:MarR family transcriptional regulator, partial [Burkholderia multivorans]